MIKKVILKIYTSEKKIKYDVGNDDYTEFHDFTIVESTNCPHLIPGESFKVRANKYPEDLLEIVTGEKDPRMGVNVEIVLREDK